jgi:hypothetical protein
MLLITAVIIRQPEKLRLQVIPNLLEIPPVAIMAVAAAVTNPISLNTIRLKDIFVNNRRKI